jgi:hypothetical protein
VSRKEFVAIWIIVLVNAVLGISGITSSLLVAVIVGFVIAGLIFMLQYVCIPWCIQVL